MKDLVTSMGIPQPTLSRAVKKLSGEVSYFEMVIGGLSINFKMSNKKKIFIEQKIHPTDSKKRVLYLNSLGKSLLIDILENRNEI